jgi:two-component system sensor histidine kinase MprB
LDRDLHAAAQLELTFLRAGFPLHPHPDPLPWDEFVRQVNRFIVSRAADGSILASNTRLANDLPLDDAAFADAVAGAMVWTTQHWLGDRVRSLYVPVSTQRPEDIMVIQVAASYAPLDRTRNELLLVMLGTVLLGTLATSLGARWLADSSVEPVLAITAQAESVQPGQSGQRITAHADIQELAGLVAVINRMIGRLESAIESQRRMIADAGHDLRTPLTAMQGEIEVVLRNPRDAETYQATLHSILEEVEHLGALSDSLVLLARLDTKDLQPDAFELELRDLVERAVQRARSRGPAHRFELVSGPEVNGVGDAQMLNLVCDHLLGNAIKHTPEGTQVTIALERDADRWTLSIVDDGPGVSDDVLPVMFERLSRGDAARSRGGAGLGLSISTAIVEAHGGTILAERSAPGGLAIHVSIPTRPPHAV